MENSSLESACLALGDALLPMADALTLGFPILLAEIGLDDVPLGIDSDSGISPKLANGAQAILQLPTSIDTLAKAIAADDLPGIASAVAGVIDEINQIIQALVAVGAAIDTYAGGAGVTHPDALRAIATALPLRLIETALVRFLEGRHPAVLGLLEVIAIVERTPLSIVIDSNGEQAPVLRRRVYWDRIGSLFSEPGKWAKDAYGWGTNDIQATLLLERAASLVSGLGLITGIDYDQQNDAAADDTLQEDDDKDDTIHTDILAGLTPKSTTDFVAPSPTPPFLDLWNLIVVPRKDLMPNGLDIQLVKDVGATQELKLAQLSPSWRLVLVLDGDVGGDVVVTIKPPFDLSVAAIASVSGTAAFKLIGESAVANQLLVLLGVAGGSRVEAMRIEFTAGGGFTRSGTGDVLIGAKCKQGRIVIAASMPDGFLKKILPANGIAIDVDFAMSWSKSKGFSFDGGAGLEVILPVHLSIADIINVDNIGLGLVVSAQGLQLDAGASFNAKLGPLTCSIAKLGLRTELDFTQGNLGPVNFGIGFLPPSGVGLALDAGPISGGGFLSFDSDNQRYAGVINLRLLSVSVTAIGLLDTKLPDGTQGFSLVLIIAVEFPPIQLGFGFTLNGIGGIVGINRTMASNALREGVRKGTIENLLFPRDPIKRAAQIVNDLKTVFPPAEGRFVFGPMIKIGWGLWVTAELALILELPSPVRIAILGRLDAIFPSLDAPVIQLHLDVAGLIDFEDQLLSIDASLHDSRLAVFNISGDMALRFSWGADPSFALSIGGFHPHFTPPAGFPTLKRLSVGLALADFANLRLEAYFALTSNSLQFGAKLQLYVHLAPIQIDGFLSFDALFIFSPFSFEVGFEAGIAIKIGSLTLLGLHLVGTLSGPTPWHFVGDLSLTLLFFEISAHVDLTFGDGQAQALPSTDPWPVLKQAVQSAQNWAGLLPDGAQAAVSLAPPEGKTAPALIDPLGAVTMRQKVLPFNQRITKFNEAQPLGPDHYNLTKVSIGTQSASHEEVDDQFAPAQFRQLTDDQKLSGPSFVQMPSGFTVASNAVDQGGATSLDVSYDTTVLDQAAVTTVSGYKPGPSVVQSLANQGPAAGSPLATTGGAKYAPDESLSEWSDAAFLVVEWPSLTTSDRTTGPQGITPSGRRFSKGLAQAALAAYLRSHPEAKGFLRVVSEHDLLSVAA